MERWIKPCNPTLTSASPALATDNKGAGKCSSTRGAATSSESAGVLIALKAGVVVTNALTPTLKAIASIRREAEKKTESGQGLVIFFIPYPSRGIKPPCPARLA
ncbi:hypothetical protein D3C85_1432140 [compost metagenome]